jgi:hypothetical protein
MQGASQINGVAGGECTLNSSDPASAVTPARWLPFTEPCFPKKREKIGMAALWLLSVSAAIEAATGFALIIYPQAVAILVATALAT